MTNQHDEDQQGRGLNKEAIAELRRFQEYLKQKYPDLGLEDSAELLYQIREERTRQLEQASLPRIPRPSRDPIDRR